MLNPLNIKLSFSALCCWILAVSLIPGTSLAQRSILFFEPDYSMDYAKHELFSPSVAYMPPHYSQFYSRTAQQKRIKEVVKKAFFTTPYLPENTLDSIVERLNYNTEGMLIQQSKKVYYRGKLTADSLVILTYKPGYIQTAVSHRLNTKAGGQIVITYQLNAANSITGYVKANTKTHDTITTAYTYDTTGLLLSGSSTAKSIKKVLFHFTYSPWNTLFTLSGKYLEKEQENKKHPSNLLHNKRTSKNAITQGSKDEAIQYLMAEDTITHNTFTCAFSAHILYYNLDKVCNPSTSQLCFQKAVYGTWNNRGKMIQSSVYKQLLPAARGYDAPSRFSAIPGLLYYFDWQNEKWNSITEKDAGTLMKEGQLIRAKIEGVHYQYQYKYF